MHTIFHLFDFHNTSIFFPFIYFFKCEWLTVKDKKPLKHSQQHFAQNPFNRQVTKFQLLQNRQVYSSGNYNNNIANQILNTNMDSVLYNNSHGYHNSSAYK